jgi:hypothetical protein
MTTHESFRRIAIVRAGWSYFGVREINGQREWGHLHLTGDVIIGVGYDRHSRRRKAHWGEAIAAQIENPGQVSECCARFAIITPLCQCYAEALAAHNAVHDRDGYRSKSDLA